MLSLTSLNFGNIKLFGKILCPFDVLVCLSMRRSSCFIATVICSTCFGHSYAHHQELETILVLLPRVVCNALVAGGRLLGVEQQAMRSG